MTFSVQQIKFECLSYIKEFGAKTEEWAIGMADDAEEALFSVCGVDSRDDIWLWKPTLSPAAARTVVDFMVARHRLHPVAGFGAGQQGRCIFMYRMRR